MRNNLSILNVQKRMKAKKEVNIYKFPNRGEFFSFA